MRVSMSPVLRVGFWTSGAWSKKLLRKWRAALCEMHQLITSLMVPNPMRSKLHSSTANSRYRYMLWGIEIQHYIHNNNSKPWASTPISFQLLGTTRFKGYKSTIGIISEMNCLLGGTSTLSSFRYHAPKISVNDASSYSNITLTVAGSGLFVVGLSITKPVHPVRDIVQTFIIIVFPSRMLECTDCVQCGA